MSVSSITKKQIVALTGLILIISVILHLAGNLLIYGGPKLFNSYAEKLEGLGLLLRIMEYGLLAVFITHIWFTVQVVLENVKARGGVGRYAIDRPVGNRSLATRIMPWTGAYLLAFVFWHLFDFDFADHGGPRSFINGHSYGLYGVVVNSFADPVHSLLYVAAMCFLALHLAHGVESSLQTFGVKNAGCAPAANRFSRYFALLMAVGFSSIPLYVLFVLK